MTSTPLCILTSLILLSGCAGEDPVSPMRTGVFLDSAVAGLNYVTESQSGTTDGAGTYHYIAGESVTFSIGDFVLPTVRAASTVTPLDIFSSDDISDVSAANLSRLLQSLDNDRDPDNGITLTQSSAFTSDAALDFSGPEFDQQAIHLLQNSELAITTLIDTPTATAHLQQTLIDNGLTSDNNTTEHPNVGRQATFTTRFHNVSGNLTILDDQTIEVQNFNYDGQGPAVYFYAAKNRMYNAADAFIIGPKLNGQVYVNDTLRLALPEGTTLNDFDSLSVWCADFQIDFGDAYFGDL